MFGPRLLTAQIRSLPQWSTLSTCCQPKKLHAFIAFSRLSKKRRQVPVGAIGAIKWRKCIIFLVKMKEDQPLPCFDGLPQKTRSSWDWSQFDWRNKHFSTWKTQETKEWIQAYRMFWAASIEEAINMTQYPDCLPCGFPCAILLQSCGGKNMVFGSAGCEDVI